MPPFASRLLALLTTALLPLALAVPTRAATDFDQARQLVEFARELDQLGLNEAGRHSHLAAVEACKGIEDQARRLNLQARLWINAGLAGNAPGGLPPAQSFEDALDWLEDPATRGFCQLALACAEGLDSRRAGGRIQKAHEEANKVLAHALLRAECMFLETEQKLLNNQIEPALNTARKLLEMSPAIGKPLYMYEAQRLLVRCYDQAGQIEKARQIAAQVILRDLSRGPVPLDHYSIEELRGMAESLRQAEHVGQYARATHAAMTLLLARRQLHDKVPESRLEEEYELYRGALLARLATNLWFQDRPLPARVMADLARLQGSREFSADAKIRRRIALGRFHHVSGETQQALEQLDLAQSMLERAKDPSGRLSVELQEERALAQLARGQADEALQRLAATRARAAELGLEQEAARLDFYLEEIPLGTTAPKALAGAFANLAHRKRQAAQLALRTQGPEAFRSPFVSDYGDDAHPPAAIALMEIALRRPQPSARPVVLSPESRMKVGQYDKAIPMLEEIIAAEGESPKRLQQLIQCYIKTRDWDMAERSCRRLLALDPDNPVAVEHLKTIEIYLKYKQGER